jgi:hypothetical protein
MERYATRYYRLAVLYRFPKYVNRLSASHSNVSNPSAVLGISVILLRDREPSTWTQRLFIATTVAPSIWPIVFTSVVGSTIQACAHHQLARGATFGRLEQLMGSQTATSTLKSIWLFRSFHPLTFVLISIWAFNPLGSQASFRMVYLGEKTEQGTMNLLYQNSSMASEVEATILANASMFEAAKPLVASLYGAALFSPDAATQYLNGSSSGRSSAQDIWGNARIPHLRSLPSFDTSESTRWVDVPYQTEEVNWTSLIGSPVQGLPYPFTGNASFGIDGSYNDFQVSNTSWMQL